MFAFEIQLDWFPGCGWLRSPHPRKDWQQAFDEGTTYVKFCWEYRGQVAAMRVVKVGE